MAKSTVTIPSDLIPDIQAWGMLTASVFNRMQRHVSGRTTLQRMVETLEQTDPALADTIALLLNDDVRGEIEQSVKEAEAGKVRPLREVVDEIRATRN